MLNFVIYICICSETWHVVYLQHPRLQFVVKHHIEAKEVTTKIGLLGLTRAIEMSQLRLHHEESLYYTLFYLMPNLVSMFSENFSVFGCACQLPLQNVLKSQFVLLLVEFFVVLVEGVIC